MIFFCNGLNNFRTTLKLKLQIIRSVSRLCMFLGVLRVCGGKRTSSSSVLKVEGIFVLTNLSHQLPAIPKDLPVYLPRAEITRACHHTC